MIDERLVEENGDGQKTGRTFTEEEAQRMIDAALGKKLKNMPAKEEVAEYRANREEFEQWKQERDGAGPLAEQLAAAEGAKAAAMKIEGIASAKLAALDAGISRERLDDAVVLAMARVSDEVTLDDAMGMVAEANPAWTGAGNRLPGLGGNPPREDAGGWEARLRKARRDGDTIEIIKIKQQAAEDGVALL